VAGICGYGEELSSSVNTGNFLTSCEVYSQLLKKDSAPWSKYFCHLRRIPVIVDITISTDWRFYLIYLLC
jgi:hypothetical protein